MSPGETATQACFDANPLVFESDDLYGAPKDPNYPGRGYIAPPEIAQADNSGKLSVLQFTLCSKDWNLFLF